MQKNINASNPHHSLDKLKRIVKLQDKPRLYRSWQTIYPVRQGKTVKLTGNNLLYNDLQQGLFFTDAKTGATLAKVHYVMEHKPSRVLFEVPETLAAGKYVFLELRSNELRKEQLQDVYKIVWRFIARTAFLAHLNDAFFF